MPILDPILQFNLSIIANNNAKTDLKHFYANYLHIASEKINQNYNAILASIQFKKDFEKCVSVISKYLSFTFNGNKDDYANLYYTILYQNDALERRKYNLHGDYYKYSFFNSSFYFFKLNLDNSPYRSWFFSDFPIAVLCLHLDQIKDEDINQIIFELDLMAAAGFTLVVCLNKFPNCKITNFDQFIEILYEHFISEIHVTFDTDHYDESFDKFITALNKKYDEFNCYFYFYVRYFEDDDFSFNSDIKIPLQNLNLDENEPIENNRNILIDQLTKNLNELESKPRIKITYFNEPIEKSLKTQELISIKPFSYCTNGFDRKMLKIFLSDVPLYSSVKSIYSCEFANIEKFKYHCYISQDTFISSEKGRIEVLYYFDKNSKNSQSEKVMKYVDFDDIHYMNLELYVKNQLSLTKTKFYIKNKCDEIIAKLENNFIPKEPDSKPSSKLSPRKKKKAKKLSQSDKIEEIFTKSLFELKKIHDEKNKTKFEFHLNQIYTAYEIVESCFTYRYKMLGSIYQIPAGEGKSEIIWLVAAVLSQMNKYVHIVTSSSFLTNKNYNESFDYFNNLGLISSALLHFNEVPIYNKNEFDPNIKKSNYHENYFGHDLFDNSMKMNFDVCNKEKNVSIIFSTLNNFQCYYLYKTEKSKMNIDEYYKNTVLLIDEADSILIDEITNGTIISRPLNSNCEKILTFVYEQYSKNNKVSAQEICNKISNKWSECTDISVNDVKNMFKEIEFVNEDKSFTNGKKYIVVNSDQEQNIFRYKEIFPFDFDSKGIIEKNKEYSGFIEQFIAIKEKYKNKNEDVVFKDISLNYLYISHPIYVKLYGNVFGLTGTLGDSYDKELLKEHYNLLTKIMPKENPNRCCQFPITLCDKIEQRNKLIVDEIISFHKKGFPVLVILFSPQEIDDIHGLIKKHQGFDSKQKIQIYQGNNIKLNPNNDSGKEGAISLGTNVCGRGFHIEIDKKHLHVIVSFYSANKRTLQQAFDRTARKNNFGSVHVICLKDEINTKRMRIVNEEIEINLKKMEIYKNMQKQFIDEFRKAREWIFDINFNYTKKIQKNELSLLRAPKINVNRITAFKYKYPICMKYSTFLDIQSQKIFSLLNCPNCKFTWKIFQQYVREMVLQSWSIFINQSEQTINSNSTNIKDIEQFLKIGKDSLVKELKKYLPDNENKVDVFNTFLHIFQEVYQKYKHIRIGPIIPIRLDNDISEKSGFDKKKIWNKFSKISLEFRPFSLIYKSGSRIREMLKNSNAYSFIEDPELKYRSAKTDKLFSITNGLDDIFDKICNMLNDFLEDHVNFKLFLRRTLAGCEFGICYDFEMENTSPDVNSMKNCLFDKNSILVFSIYINSTIPFLAGVLIFLINYLSLIIKNLITFAQSKIKGLNVSGFKLFASIIQFIGEQEFDKDKENICDELSKYLENKIFETIERFKITECEQFYYLIAMLTNILAGKNVEKGDEFAERIANKLNNPKLKKGMKMFFKIGFLSVLWLVSHMLNFQFNFLFKEKLAYTVEKDSEFLKNDHSSKAIDDIIDKNSKILESEKIQIDLI